MFYEICTKKFFQNWRLYQILVTNLKSFNFLKFMAALPSVWLASCRCLIDHTTGNKMHPQHRRSTRITKFFHATYSLAPSSLSSRIISATFARTWRGITVMKSFLSLGVRTCLMKVQPVPTNTKTYGKWVSFLISFCSPNRLAKNTSLKGDAMFRTENRKKNQKNLNEIASSNSALELASRACIFRAIYF